MTEEKKRLKVLTISDHPLLPSGVGTQTQYVIRALLDSDKFDVISLAGAIKHNDYREQRTEEYGERWRILPVNDYGNAEIVRSIIRSERPDILYFMTDPRFYEWLWNMEDEIRPLLPMVYYHVWDNGPLPKFNKPFYESNDFIATISKVTSNIVQGVAPNVNERYIPHAVDSEVFSKIKDKELLSNLEVIKEQNDMKGKFVCFWNNRNARRKQSGTLIFWWKQFLDKVGHDKATLLMHTDINDHHGQPLQFLCDQLGLNNGQVQFNEKKVSSSDLATFYNIADCTLNIADAEGFGLATLESLSCETPIIVNMTGGLQEQVTDGKDWFGIGIEPSSKAVIGSLSVPYIYEDRISEKDFVDALVKMYEMSPKERAKLGKKGRAHVMKHYNFDDFKSTWVDTMVELHNDNGSWDTRKNYNSWESIEL